MGNTHSNSPTLDVFASLLSPKAQRRLSESPLAETLFGQSNPRRKALPSIPSYYSARSGASRKKRAAAAAAAAAIAVTKHRSSRTSSSGSNLSMSTAETSHSEDTAGAPDTPLMAPLCFPQRAHLSALDNDESDRLIVLHFLSKHVLNANFLAPVSDTLCGDDERFAVRKPQVLDVGCGPGTWILEMATDYPQTEFHGVDASQMFPTTIKPPNAFFKHHDIIQSLPYDDASFDYIFMRHMLGCFSKIQLRKIVAEIFRVLKPGGYFEILDVEYMVRHAGPQSTKVNQGFQHLMKSLDVDLELGDQLHTTLIKPQTPRGGGFVDLHSRQIEVPLHWGGPVGDLHGQNFDALMRSVGPAIKLATPDSASINLDQIAQECKDNKSHLNWYMCHCRKSRDNRLTLISASAGSTPPSSPTTPRTPVMPTGREWEQTVKEFIDGYTD